MKCLVDSQGRQLTLRSDAPTRVGRSSDNDLVISDETVSHHHAVISFDGDRAFVRDLDSFNGTYLQGSRIKGGRLTNDSIVKFGMVSFTYKEAAEVPAVAPIQHRPATSSPRDSSPLSWRDRISWPAAAGVGAVILALIAIALHSGGGTSAPAGQTSTSANLMAGQDFRLPNATSDFVGDWCGTVRVVSCEPAGSCDDEAAPISLSFLEQGGAGGDKSVVALHYQILAADNAEVRDIRVEAPDSRHVVVSYSAIVVDTSGLERLTKVHQELLSIDATAVRESDSAELTLDGTVLRRDERVARLEKCSEDFQRTQAEYIKRHGLQERGEVSGNVP
jgi:FHA domain-containing protein